MCVCGPLYVLLSSLYESSKPAIAIDSTKSNHTAAGAVAADAFVARLA